MATVFRLNGRVVTEREFLADVKGIAFEAPPRRSGCRTWPQACEALAVHPDQIAEAHANAGAQGVPTQYAKDGSPIFTGPKHRREYCERIEGAYDRNGGYSDPRGRR